MEIVIGRVYKVSYRGGRYEAFDIQRVNGKMCAFMINVNDAQDCTWVNIDALILDRQGQLDLI